MAENESPQPSHYGRRPVWQWVLLYILVGAVIYGLIYYFFLRDTGSTGTNGGGLY